jgi:hypothetical protein
MLDGAQLNMTGNGVTNLDQLRSIQTFEQLIPFLEEDLDWPFPEIGRDYEFDDLTFEYTPDELGLEPDYAAKIKRIRQLRPLVSGQPWGIFFVEFENKKLPIVVLRRILSHLVLKQRKSANPADRARWNAGDLLFISAFAEEGTLQREIAFAHFHQYPGDQPTLRVLGWDGGEPVLLVGEPGTGKSHLATGLAIAACRQRRRVRFTTAAALVNQLVEAQREQSLSRMLARWSRVELIVIDELGYVPLAEVAAELLFQVIAERAEKAAIIVTTNLPFSEWPQVFTNARLCKAVLDRLTDQAHII